MNEATLKGRASACRMCVRNINAKLAQVTEIAVPIFPQPGAERYLDPEKGKCVGCIPAAAAIAAKRPLRPPDFPLASGSGVTADNVRGLLSHLDVLIIGTWFKQHGDVKKPVDPKRVTAMVDLCRKAMWVSSSARWGRVRTLHMSTRCVALSITPVSM